MISNRCRLAFSQLSRNVKGTNPHVASFGGAGDKILLTGSNIGSIRDMHSPAVKRDIRRKKAMANKPTMAIAKSMAINYEEMDNQSLVTIAHMENHEACSEVLKRHIMAVDNVNYEEACKTFDVIAAKNREGMLLAALPYQIGFGLAGTAAFCSIPLVFDLNTAIWFNENYVTTDVPPPEDLETWLEVGSWTWNWMEPPLGQISFFLLCLQFSRYVAV